MMDIDDTEQSGDRKELPDGDGIAIIPSKIISYLFLLMLFFTTLVVYLTGFYGYFFHEFPMVNETELKDIAFSIFQQYGCESFGENPTFQSKTDISVSSWIVEECQMDFFLRYNDDIIDIEEWAKTNEFYYGFQIAKQEYRYLTSNERRIGNCSNVIGFGGEHFQILSLTIGILFEDETMDISEDNSIISETNNEIGKRMNSFAVQVLGMAVQDDVISLATSENHFILSVSKSLLLEDVVISEQFNITERTNEIELFSTNNHEKFSLKEQMDLIFKIFGCVILALLCCLNLGIFCASRNIFAPFLMLETHNRCNNKSFLARVLFDKICQYNPFSFFKRRCRHWWIPIHFSYFKSTLSRRQKIVIVVGIIPFLIVISLFAFTLNVLFFIFFSAENQKLEEQTEEVLEGTRQSFDEAGVPRELSGVILVVFLVVYFTVVFFILCFGLLCCIVPQVYSCFACCQVIHISSKRKINEERLRENLMEKDFSDCSATKDHQNVVWKILDVIRKIFVILVFSILGIMMSIGKGLKLGKFFSQRMIQDGSFSESVFILLIIVLFFVHFIFVGLLEELFFRLFLQNFPFIALRTYRGVLSILTNHSKSPVRRIEEICQEFPICEEPGCSKKRGSNVLKRIECLPSIFHFFVRYRPLVEIGMLFFQAAIFAFLHFNYFLFGVHIDWSCIFFYFFVFGLGMGIVYLLERDIWVLVTIHSIVDFGILSYTFISLGRWEINSMIGFFLLLYLVMFVCIEFNVHGHLMNLGICKEKKGIDEEMEVGEGEDEESTNDSSFTTEESLDDDDSSFTTEV